MKAGLKKECIPEVKDAWKKLEKVVTKIMCSDFYTNPDILLDELSDHKIELVRKSWAKVLELGEETVGKVIFKNLFEADE